MTHHEVARTLAAMPWLWIKSCLELPERGRYYPAHAVVLTRRGMSQAQWNCTVLHEAIHAERGDVPCCTAWHERKQERLVEAETARRLISLERLVIEMLWTQDLDELADALRVDRDTLRTRLAGLTDDENRAIEDRLYAAERWIA